MTFQNTFPADRFQTNKKYDSQNMSILTQYLKKQDKSQVL